MKAVFACRDGEGGRFIATRLVRQGLVEGLVIESGKKARAAKWQRMKKRIRPWTLPVAALDIASLLIYTRVCERALRDFVCRQEDICGYPAALSQCRTDDINDPDCLAFLRQQNTDVLLTYGTAILRDEALGIASRGVLNLHGGIVPYYRNVHCDFWAFRKGDTAKIGCSVLHLDAGIDSGDVALRRSIDYAPGDSLRAVKKKLLLVAADLAAESLLLAAQDHLPRKPQESSTASFCPTPGFSDLLSIVHQF
jgi:methionyl-tRNA formyltransferase